MNTSMTGRQARELKAKYTGPKAFLLAAKDAGFEHDLSSFGKLLHAEDDEVLAQYILRKAKAKVKVKGKEAEVQGILQF